MPLRTVRSVKSLPTVRRALHSSTTAPTPSHLLSTQQTNGRGHFNSLTMPKLKQECKQRGLKLTGRKVELVDRIVGFEQAKSFSSSSAAQKPTQTVTTKKPAAPKKPVAPKEPVQCFSTSAAVEDTFVDSFSVPQPPAGKKQGKVTKIPIKFDGDGKATLHADYSERKLTADTGASAGDIHIVDSNTTRVSLMNVDLGSGDAKYDEERTGYNETDHMSAPDKTFLWSLGALIAGWWALGASTKKRETK